MMEFSLKDFGKTLFEIPKNEAIEEVKKLGWTKHRYFNKYANTYVDKDGILKEFDLPMETKVETSLMVV